MEKDRFLKILKIEKIKLDEKKVELVELLNKLTEYKERLVFYNEKINKYWTLENMRNEIILNYLKDTTERIIGIEKILENLEEKIRIKKEEIVEQYIEVKKYEKLIERYEENYRLEQQRKEQKELDEIISVYYNKKRI